MQTIRKKQRAIGAFLLAGIAGALVWRFLPREPTLLRQATCVASDIRPFYVGKPPTVAEYDPYFWKSPHEALLFHLTMHVPPQCRVELYDTATGAQRLMPAFSRLFQQSAVSDMRIVQWFEGPGHDPGARGVIGGTFRSVCSVSPDGKWMLYYNCVGGANNPFRPMAIALDGSWRIVWPVLPESRYSVALRPFWLPDSRRWAEILYDNTTRKRLEAVYGLNGEHHVQAVAWEKGDAEQETCGVTRSGSVLVRKYTPQSSPIRAVTFTAWDLPDILADRANAPTRAHTLTIPMPAHTIDTNGLAPRLSPQGDRLAWVLILDNAPPEPAWLQRLRSWFGQGKQRTMGLWVSGLDGSAMREIGHIAYRPGDEVPQDIRWTPDGKRLSFLYKGALYTVPVD